jgi:hypothetical protein
MTSSGDRRQGTGVQGTGDRSLRLRGGLDFGLEAGGTEPQRRPEAPFGGALAQG